MTGENCHTPTLLWRVMNDTRETLTPQKPDLLSPDDLSDLLSIPLATIYRWRSCGDGPRAMKLGRHVRYRMADVELWLESCADEPARLRR